jgi:hypothetical protein
LPKQEKSVASSVQSFVRYTPDVEQPEDDEDATAQGLVETLQSISEQTLADGGHVMRSVHAKAHGILVGELKVAPALPEYLAQGLFATAAIYPIVMRFSTIPGDILDDSVSTPRGLAIKIIGVAGDRLEGSELDVTQDLVLVNGPAFGAPSAKKFLATLKLLAKTTDRAEGLKKVISGALRGVQRVIVGVTRVPSPTIATLGGQPETHILGESFYSQAPVRYGNYIAKLAVVPVSSELTALVQAPLNLNGVPNGLRDAVVEFFHHHSGTWEVRAQLCTDLDEMPVEDASKVWPEKKSPYRAVARITVKPQTAWSEARATAVDDGMSFSPWHGLAAHRPLGSIMRVRKLAYEMGRRFRSEHGGRTIEEPKELPLFGD